MLNEKLEKYLEHGFYPFHMPGHKRNKKHLNKNLPYDRDLTEIEGFDNLNDPKSIFLYMENSLSKIYDSKDAIISTNGSTCGILASIRSLSRKYKRILISRASHKSIYNAAEIFDLDIDYINMLINKEGLISDIDYQDLSYKLENNSYDLVIITSPTYDGYLIDLNTVHNLCKKYSTLLLVDMAHGSHINLYEDYNSLFSYDLAITSFHKNLSALTPSACVLVKNRKVDTKEIRRNMAIFQTSSPSYLISQSIEDMINSYPKFYNLKNNLDTYLSLLYETKLEKLSFVNEKRKDKSKILISTQNTNISGYELQELLLKKNIEIEMAQPSYVLLISSIFDTKEGFDTLIDALISIDKDLKFKESNFVYKNIIPEKRLKISTAINSKKKSHKIDEIEGKISSQYIYSYPPGIPIIVPGEVFTKDIIEQIKYLIYNGANLSIDNGHIFVVN